MKRYYLSKIKAVEIPGMGTVWRHRFQEIGGGLNYVGGEIAVDPQTGVPTQKALLILVEAPDHTVFANDAEMADFPDAGLATRISAVGALSKVRAQAKARKLGLTRAEVDDLWDGAGELREVLDRYGRMNNPAFDSLKFDV